MMTMMRFDLYGGNSGLVLIAQKLSEEDLRKRFDEFLRHPEDGHEFRVECVSDALRAERNE
jgi:hypothetical protein